ncbi:uncharacterized protein LOC128237757 isoform X2 [Mya arenaria]|uniref:uncharacterized protein LOC128237757 isoform X2 n=1 Tax=Mya arenaria TaxID=6604 RepID=UPI0022E058DB|nr:uncharacterized protein LOC128237757 isoform X2 [Mya arenaria]
MLSVLKMSTSFDLGVLVFLIVPAYDFAPNEFVDYIQIPPEKCFISSDDFKTKVVGNYYTSAYIMAAGLAGGVPEPRNIGERATYLWTIKPDGRVRRSSGFWSFGCRVIDEFWPQASCRAAEFHPIGSSVNLSIPTLRSEVLISCDPENYVVRVFCDGAEIIPKSRCNNSAAFVLIRDRRVDDDGDGLLDENPDYSGTDWCKIDRLIRACLGTKLVEWQWHSLQCPRPR